MQNGTIRLAKKGNRYILAIQPPLRPYERERAEALLRKADLSESMAALDVYGFTLQALGAIPENRDDNFLQLGVRLEQLLGNRALQREIVVLQIAAQAAAEINEGQT